MAGLIMVDEVKGISLCVLRVSVLLSFGVFLAACKGGIRFTDKEVTENALLPPVIQSSIPANIYRHDISLLTGMLAIKNKDGVITTYLRAVDQAPIVTIIPDDKRLVYQSIISAKGNAILKSSGVSTSINGSQMAELVINQTEVSALKDLPYAKIVEESKKIHTNPDQTLVYIAAATLYYAKTTVFDELESDAVVEYGPVIGMNGKAYKSSGSTRNDYTIYLNVVDVSALTGSKDSGSIAFSETPVKYITLPAPTAPQISILPTPADISEARPALQAKVDAPVMPVVKPVEFPVPKKEIKIVD
jgi:hypothetical protein